MSAGARLTWGLGAFGAVATAFQLLEKGGAATLVCAVLIGAATMIVLHPKRSASSLVGSAATLVVALILAAFGLAGNGGDDDGRQASTSTVPDEGVVPPTVPTTAATATTPTMTATTPTQRPPPTPDGVRTTQLEWDDGPATKRALGALLIIGSIDFAVDDDDDEDVLRRLLVRVNAARCPKRTSWQDVRTGDRFEMAVGRHRYEIFVDHVEYANYAEPDLTTTVTRRPRAGGGPTLCARS